MEGYGIIYENEDIQHGINNENTTIMNHNNTISNRNNISNTNHHNPQVDLTTDIDSDDQGGSDTRIILSSSPRGNIDEDEREYYPNTNEQDYDEQYDPANSIDNEHISSSIHLNQMTSPNQTQDHLHTNKINSPNDNTYNTINHQSDKNYNETKDHEQYDIDSNTNHSLSNRYNKETESDNSNNGTIDKRGPDYGKVFIGGVSWDTTEEGLRSHFGKFGNITDATIMKDKYTNQPRGFGFVSYDTLEAVDKVLSQSHTLDGRTVEVKRAIPRDKAPSDGSDIVAGPSGVLYSTEKGKIFVGGLPITVTDSEFRDYFMKFGNITDAVVMVDRDTRRSRGFGFITYEDEAVVDKILSTSHELHGKVVDIKKAEPKELSRSNLAASAAAGFGSSGGHRGGAAGFNRSRVGGSGYARPGYGASGPMYGAYPGGYGGYQGGPPGGYGPGGPSGGYPRSGYMRAGPPAGYGPGPRGRSGARAYGPPARGNYMAGGRGPYMSGGRGSGPYGEGGPDQAQHMPYNGGPGGRGYGPGPGGPYGVYPPTSNMSPDDSGTYSNSNMEGATTGPGNVQTEYGVGGYDRSSYRPNRQGSERYRPY